MSTLHPGKKSTKIVKLRDAAMKELDALPKGVTQHVEVKFDKEIQNKNKAGYDQDDNGVSNYPGQNSPHIGNGSGGLR